MIPIARSLPLGVERVRDTDDATAARL